MGVKSHRVRITRACGASGHDIQKLLARHGITIWSRGVTRNEIRFRVKERQARWAEYVLRRQGLPVLSNYAGDADPDPRLGPMPGERAGVDGLVHAKRERDWIDRLLGG